MYLEMVVKSKKPAYSQLRSQLHSFKMTAATSEMHQVLSDPRNLVDLFRFSNFVEQKVLKSRKILKRCKGKKESSKNAEE